MKIWYEIKKVKDLYIVFKNVEGHNSIGSKQKFKGSKQECIKFCNDNNIILKNR